jgi:hypothetical protein
MQGKPCPYENHPECGRMVIDLDFLFESLRAALVLILALDPEVVRGGLDFSVHLRGRHRAGGAVGIRPGPCSAWGALPAGEWRLTLLNTLMAADEWWWG